MPADLPKIRALLASLVGFTEGPWRIAHSASRGGVDSCKVYTDALGEHPVCIGEVNGFRYLPADQRLFASAPDLHRHASDLADEVERLRQRQDNMQAMLDEIWCALDAAGVSNEIDTREMVQVSEDTFEEAGERRQADPAERVAMLAGGWERLRAAVETLRAGQDEAVAAAVASERADVVAFLLARQACRAAERDEARGDAHYLRLRGAAAELADAAEEVEAGNHARPNGGAS